MEYSYRKIGRPRKVRSPGDSNSGTSNMSRPPVLMIDDIPSVTVDNMDIEHPVCPQTSHTAGISNLPFSMLSADDNSYSSLAHTNANPRKTNRHTDNMDFNRRKRGCPRRPTSASVDKPASSGSVPQVLFIADNYKVVQHMRRFYA